MSLGIAWPSKVEHVCILQRPLQLQMLPYDSSFVSAASRGWGMLWVIPGLAGVPFACKRPP